MFNVLNIITNVNKILRHCHSWLARQYLAVQQCICQNLACVNIYTPTVCVWVEKALTRLRVWTYAARISDNDKYQTLVSWLFAFWEIVHAFLSSADFFQNQLFRKILSGIASESQTNWIQIRPDKTSGLIRVQTVGKSYQQTTLGDTELMIRHNHVWRL